MLYDTSAVPENYKNSNGKKITHPFGDDIEVGPRGTDGDSGYYVLLNKIPKAACINLATMNFGTSMAGVGVGDNIASTLGNGNTTTDMPDTTTASRDTIYSGAFNPSQASTACNQDYNDIGYMLK